MPETTLQDVRPESEKRQSAESPLQEARRQLIYELISGASGLALAVFMWMHMLFVGSILTGERGFDWVAKGMEDIYLAQPTVVIILVLFLVHAVTASRKIPAQLRERKRVFALARALKLAPHEWPGISEGDSRLRPHLESWLWIWQVRTGMVMLVLGSFHLILMMLDIFTPLFGEAAGIEAVSSMARVGSGLFLLYGVLLLCVEFHAGVGLFRLAVKWGVGARFTRARLWFIEKILFWVFIGLGTLILLVLGGWIQPPLAFLLD